MPRKPGKVPSYCLHKHSGRAVVRIDDEDHYLGPYGSEESYELYERVIAEWRVKRQQQPARSHRGRTKATGNNLTVEQVLGLYWEFASSYYVKDGKPTGELVNLKYALKPVRALYGRLPARDFGPLALKAVRQHLIDADLSRNGVNARVDRIKRVFKWAVSEELIPPSVYEGLRAVVGIRFGRTSARETPPVKPVADAVVEATLPYLTVEVAAMVRLQRLTGMRPGEVVQLREAEIDTTQDIWIFEPADHKGRWRGHQKLVPLGPQAQAIIKDFMPPNPQEYVFSPKRAEARRNCARRQARKTPMTPSQAKRRPKARPRRPKRERFDDDSFRRAIARGITIAARHGVLIEHWHPNQLRHTRGTELRKRHGLEAAQVSLGHSRADVTQIYAERDMTLAITIAAESG